MTNFEFKKLVNKYAIILIIAYGVRFLIGIILQQISPETLGLDRELHLLAINSTWIFQFLVNIVAALFVVSDSKKLKINNNLIIFATIIFSLVGISMFLLLINRETHKANA